MEINANRQPMSGITDVNRQVKSEEERTKMQKDDFLKLFVTSLQYQNPLDPMKNGEMMQQLSQLGMMEQVTNMSDTVNKLSENVIGTQVQQGASLLGKEITAVTGDGETVTGLADKVSFNDGIMEILVKEKTIKLGQIREINL